MSGEEQPSLLSSPTDLASEATKFLQRQSPKWSCVTYRTLCRKFSLSARAGKRLLWTILKSKRKDISREDEEETTTTLACVYAITSARGVELRVLNAGKEFDCNEDEELNEVAVYALVKRKEDGESVLEQLVSEEEAQTKAILDAEKEEEESGSWTLKFGTFEKSEIAKRLPRGKRFVSAATKATTTTTATGSEQKKPVAGAAAKKPAAGGGPKSGNIASMFGGTGKKTVAKPKEPAKKKVTPKKKTLEKKKAKTPTPKKAPVATNADAMIEDEEGDSDSDDLGGGGRRNRGGKRAFVDDEEEEEDEEPATTPVKKMKKSDEDSEPPSPEIIDKEPEEETPRRRSTRSTPLKATPTPKSSSKKEKPLSKKAQKDIIKARKARMQKKVIEEMDDETGEELMRTVFVDPETGEECNEDGTLKAK